MARWTGRLLLLAVAVAIAWWLMADTSREQALVDAPAPPAHPTREPERVAPCVVVPERTSLDASAPSLAGMTYEQAATRRAQEKLQRLEALRSAGVGGFLADTLLEGTCCITGRVLGAGGVPVSGTAVGIDVPGGGAERALADPDGRFTLEFTVPEGPFQFVALAAGAVTDRRARLLPR